MAEYREGSHSRYALKIHLVWITKCRKNFWGQHIWARGYFAVSTGTVTDEVVKQYVESRSIKEMNYEDYEIGEEL